MNRYYSAETGSFYDENLHGPLLIEAPQTAREKKAGKRPALVVNPATKIPADAVVISEEHYHQLLEAQSAGQQIVARGGKPVAASRAPSDGERAASRRLERDRRLRASDWTQLGDVLLDDLPTKGAWAAYRQTLRDIDVAGDDWPTPPMSAA